MQYLWEYALVGSGTPCSGRIVLLIGAWVALNMLPSVVIDQSIDEGEFDIVFGD